MRRMQSAIQDTREIPLKMAYLRTFVASKNRLNDLLTNPKHSEKNTGNPLPSQSYQQLLFSNYISEKSRTPTPPPQIRRLESRYKGRGRCIEGPQTQRIQALKGCL